MSAAKPGEMRIGEALAAARGRAGLDLASVEERTKIRARYLRALEAERWDELPSGAYGKGFLRTYAELLGLDADTLVDEYRRQVEGVETPSMHPFGDAVLDQRRRSGRNGDRPRIGVLAAALVGATALGILLVAALLVSGDDDPRPGGVADQARQRGERGREAVRPEGTVELALAIRDPVEVCLLGGRGEALIDGQVLPAGGHERFERRRFELRFPKGFDPEQLRVKLDGERRRLPKADGPASFEIVAPRHLRLSARAPRQACP